MDFDAVEVSLFRSVCRVHLFQMIGTERAHGQHDAAADARERIAEIGEILAVGLLRLKARQSSQLSDATGESSLEPIAHQSGHANAEREIRR